MKINKKRLLIVAGITLLYLINVIVMVSLFYNFTNRVALEGEPMNSPKIFAIAIGLLISVLFVMIEFMLGAIILDVILDVIDDLWRWIKIPEEINNNSNEQNNDDNNNILSPETLKELEQLKEENKELKEELNKLNEFNRFQIMEI